MLSNTVPMLDDEASSTHYTYDRYDGHGGVPHEVCFELSAAVGADAWINIPYDADVVGYVMPLAIEAADWAFFESRNVIVEYGSEVWNPLFGYQFCHVVDTMMGCTTCNPLNPPPLDPALEACVVQFLASHSDTIFDIFEAEFAARGIPDRLERVIGGRINSSSYTSQLLATIGGPDEVDHIALNTYFGQRSVRDVGWDELQTISDEDFLAYLHSVIQGGPYKNLRDFLVPQRASVESHNAGSAPPDDVRLAAYEGGQSLIYDWCDCPDFCPTQNDPDCWAEMQYLTQRFYALNRGVAMFELYYDLLDLWEEMSSVDGGPGGRWMHFAFIQEVFPAGGGAWGLLEYTDSDPALSPKYLAVQESQAR